MTGALTVAFLGGSLSDLTDDAAEPISLQSSPQRFHFVASSHAHMHCTITHNLYSLLTELHVSPLGPMSVAVPRVGQLHDKQGNNQPVQCLGHYSGSLASDTLLAVMVRAKKPKLFAGLHQVDT